MPPSGPTSLQRARGSERKRSPTIKELPLCEARDLGQLHSTPHFPEGSVFKNCFWVWWPKSRQPRLHFQQVWALLTPVDFTVTVQGKKDIGCFLPVSQTTASSQSTQCLGLSLSLCDPMNTASAASMKGHKAMVSSMSNLHFLCS